MKKFLKAVLVMVVLASMFTTSAMAEWMAVSEKTYAYRFPNVYSEVRGTMTQGTLVNVLTHIYTTDGKAWAAIDLDGKDAYVSEEYLTMAERPKYTNETEFPFLTLAEVNVRRWPDIEAEVLGLYPNRTTVYGSRFYPNENGDVWLEVIINEKENGEREYGYIHTHNLQIQQERCNVSDVRHFAPTMMTTGAVNVRSDCTMEAEVVMNLSEHRYVQPSILVCTDDGNTARIWAYCYRNEKPIGFISCLNLTK